MNSKRSKSIFGLILSTALMLTALAVLSLAQPATGTGATSLTNEAGQQKHTVTARTQASTGENVPLAGAEEWAHAHVEISGAPDDAVVSSVRVKYHIDYAEPGELEVRLQNSEAEMAHTLWNKESADRAVLTQSSGEIMAFQGAPVNGTWSLAVQGGDTEGYIDGFGIVVYFETDMPFPQVEGEGPPGTPGFLRLPQDTAPVSPSLDVDEKPSEGGAPVAPQDVPPGATIIKTENFEGAFPNGLWAPHDNSNDGYERYWDDAGCDECGGDWAIWPADGGADGIYPCTPSDYPNNMYAWVEYGPFDLSDASDAGTEFVMWHEIEVDYDWIFFGVSADGSSYTGLFWDGSSGCTLHNINYADWAGDPSVWVAWVFYSDDSVTYEGPYVDDVVVWKEPQTCATVKTDPPEAFANANSAFAIDVSIEGAVDLGAFEFELTYDSACVTANQATLGPFLGSTGRSVFEVGPTFGAGTVTYGGYSTGVASGPNGDGVLATVTFQAGANVCDSALHLQNVLVTDTTGAEQCTSPVDGIVHVVSECDTDCPEDINLDGVVNIVDIMLVAAKWGQSCPTRP